MKNLTALYVSGLVLFSCNSSAAQTVSIDEATGIKTWKTHVHGVGFSVTQILPDQARAFYVNRGFSLKQIENYSTSCIFMAVLRNDSADGTIHYISNQWQVYTDSKLHKLVTVDEWVNRLSQEKAKKSALIAFRWAQFHRNSHMNREVTGTRECLRLDYLLERSLT